MKVITMKYVIPIICCLNLCLGALFAQTPNKVDVQKKNLLVNGNFENGTNGWNTLWMREDGAARAILDSTEYHEGTQALRIEHTGQKDWSLGHSLSMEVQPGDIYELTAWVRFQGAGSVTLGVVTRNADGKTIDWAHGKQTTRETEGWVSLCSRFVVPQGVTTIWPRLIGDGPANIWCDDFSLTHQGSLVTLRTQGLPAEVTIRNATIEVSLRTADASFSVKDKRTNKVWVQRTDNVHMIVLDVKANKRTIYLKLLDSLSMCNITASVSLDGDAPEVIVSIDSKNEMNDSLNWPVPFTSAKGQLLIIPVNEGISYPTDDESLPSMHYSLYAGHGLCMPWYGAVEGEAGWMAVIETPDDAEVSILRQNGLLVLAPEWVSQKQHFGPKRIIRYVIFDKGNYIAMTKRYREYAKKTGLFKTLADKRKAIPAVDLLVGAVNIWCWDKDASTWCNELQKLGIKRILWSSALPPEQIKTLNEMGVLTSRYDIYQDAMNPENFPNIRWLHPDWTSDAWKNDDLMIGANGEWVRGWKVEAKNGEMISCGTLCDRQAVAYAKRRIPLELATHSYRCRFIDTTTASPWRECYHPNHPMTRTESKQFKMELLQYISEGSGLVCGSETGHDAAVPFVHYFEGMLSLGPYRVPDSGRNMMQIWNEVPEKVAKFQTGSFYRLPLWELVYHDCVVSQWYWGDYNNKLPKLWDRRDLWNALYGTPPMFMFDRKIWNENKERFVKSYQTATVVARATGYSEMLSHEWLTSDHTVQQTRFANGVVVTVNFGDTPYSLTGGTTLAPLAQHIEGIR
jgi:hypothetical protein